MKQKIKRKNPHLHDIREFINSNSIEWKYLDGGTEANAFYFRLNKKLILNTQILQPGEYVLKVFHERRYFYSEENIDTYLKLSKYGIIPKVFVITSHYIVMKYIHGKTLIEIYDELNEKQRNIIIDKIKKLWDIWKKLGFSKYIDHGEDNILVSDDLKHVYLIDPWISRDFVF